MSSRSHWKPLAALAATVVGVLTSWLLIRKAQERQEFVSKVISGYRCRITLSPSWQAIDDGLTTVCPTTERYPFSPMPNPVQKWITSHLFPSNESNQNVAPKIVLDTYLVAATPDFTKIRSGYPEFDFSNVGTQKVLSERHFWIDGCPATLESSDVVFNGKTYRGMRFIVCTPDYHTEYIVARSETLPDNNQADSEMQAIIASFHVEKVTGDKR